MAVAKYAIAESANRRSLAIFKIAGPHRHCVGVLVSSSLCRMLGSVGYELCEMRMCLTMSRFSLMGRELCNLLFNVKIT